MSFFIGMRICFVNFGSDFKFQRLNSFRLSVIDRFTNLLIVTGPGILGLRADGYVPPEF